MKVYDGDGSPRVPVGMVVPLRVFCERVGAVSARKVRPVVRESNPNQILAVAEPLRACEQGDKSCARRLFAESASPEGN